MIDRFSVELRRHLVESADEVVPADRLETIQRLVGVVPQQAPWHVRLRWLVSPWAPYANAGARTAILAAAALLLLAATIGMVALGGGSQGARSPFEGTWTAIDPSDDSVQTLVIGPGPTPEIHYRDAFSASCERAGDASTVFLFDTTGEVQGSRLLVHETSGGCRIHQVFIGAGTYDYDSVSDVLLDGLNATWTRVEVPPSAP
jgi:hypothetical protein